MSVDICINYFIEVTHSIVLHMTWLCFVLFLLINVIISRAENKDCLAKRGVKGE